MEDWRRNLIEDDEGQLLGLLRSARRVAVLGIKTDAARGQPAYYVPQALLQMGLEIVPVPVYYPDATEILGQKVYPRPASSPAGPRLREQGRRRRASAPWRRQRRRATGSSCTQPRRRPPGPTPRAAPAPSRR